MAMSKSMIRRTKPAAIPVAKSTSTAAKTIAAPKTSNNVARTVHQTASPFTKAQWPTLRPNDHDIVTSLLTALLEPIGRHRAAHIVPSKGKRDRKRKRKSAQETPSVTTIDPPIPPAPEITHFTTIGYNSTVRALESSSSSFMAVVFVTGNPDWPPYAQLPIICGLRAQQAHRELRLVLLDSKSESALCAALGIPRLGVLGIRADAPGSNVLMEVLTEKVPPVEAPWKQELDLLVQGKWLGAKIEVARPLVQEPER